MTIVFVLFLALLAPALLLALLLIHCWALQHRPRGGVGAHAKGTECDASYTPQDANGFLYHGGGKADDGEASGSGRLGHLSLLAHCLRQPAGRSKPPVASPSVLENSDLMRRTRSMSHNRLREMSAAQALAAPGGSAVQGRHDSSVHSAGAASSVSGGGERFDALTGFSSVFKEPGRVSAVDLSQGLVLEEYCVLQEEYDDVDGLQQDVSVSSIGELRRRKGDSQGRMENKLSTVLSGHVGFGCTAESVGASMQAGCRHAPPAASLTVGIRLTRLPICPASPPSCRWLICHMSGLRPPARTRARPQGPACRVRGLAASSWPTTPPRAWRCRSARGCRRPRPRGCRRRRRHSRQDTQ